MTTGARSILVVDDEDALRTATARILERCGYEVHAAGDVTEAEAVIATTPVALALLDLDLPGESGLSFARRLAARDPDIAVLMVTGVEDPAVAGVALEQGAYGYLIKPVTISELRIDVANALRRRSLEIENRAHRSRLEALVAERTEALQQSLADVAAVNRRLAASREELIRRLGLAAERKDPETGLHLERMSQYAALLGRLTGMGPDEVELLRLASPMHDIGKIGIPDSVLLKSGLYTPEDRAVIAAHPRIGWELLRGSDSELLELAATVALTHHERWDGSGYPDGRCGEDIPIAGRITAIADVFDALTTARRYKPAMTTDDAVALMGAESGRHFDPRLLELFLGALDEVEAIRSRFADVEGPPPRSWST